MTAVASDKAVHPGVAHALRIEARRKILYHLPRRRQCSLCEVFNIPYEFLLLLWVELLLLGLLSFLACLTALVSSRQCSAKTPN
jgi:hypothetical protein